MSEPRTGEIFLSGPIIDPVDAAHLGSVGIRLCQQYRNYMSRPISGIPMSVAPGNGPVTELSGQSSLILANERDMQLVLRCHQVFGQILFTQTDTEFDFSSDLFVGSANNARWHIDYSKGYRMLVNLSKTALGLQIAKSEKELIEPGNLHPLSRLNEGDLKPDTTLFYPPGSSLIIDNIADNQNQIPHCALGEENKAFLRIFANPLND